MHAVNRQEFIGPTVGASS